MNDFLPEKPGRLIFWLLVFAIIGLLRFRSIRRLLRGLYYLVLSPIFLPQILCHWVSGRPSARRQGPVAAFRAKHRATEVFNALSARPTWLAETLQETQLDPHTSGWQRLEAAFRALCRFWALSVTYPWRGYRLTGPLRTVWQVLAQAEEPLDELQRRTLGTVIKLQAEAEESFYANTRRRLFADYAFVFGEAVDRRYWMWLEHRYKVKVPYLTYTDTEDGQVKEDTYAEGQRQRAMLQEAQFLDITAPQARA